MAFPYSARLNHSNIRPLQTLLWINLIGGILIVGLFVIRTEITRNVIAASEIACLLVAFHCILLWFAGLGNTKFLLAKQFKAFIKGATILFFSCLFFHFMAVCFGAPLFTHTSETFHFAMLLSCCTFLPVLVSVGANFSLWLKIFVENSPDDGCEQVAFILFVCSIIGAWLGAFPIPLDWDRPWQVWPISCEIGTLCGYLVGLVVSSGLTFRKTKKAYKVST
ncbi:phosphatidylinositol-glycan biosynthesis class F protein [Octopus bimaculoides]|uniref:Phosphatidylinositol-glycan biosynthesis class F protein n=1 Tax=Octopus bimaculoides TaxID=37653 RepID=A0A0L8H2I8_OCTBM|nr:phosphatidylinositol-glycan biosynthesis class F protein [Octopus bimaculoides]|eukprot:XP_014775891.1 PREDICTED: phosphatidylinositol-glycan biosynthesis class F protein-like [Octopus bimaculoides]